MNLFSEYSGGTTFEKLSGQLRQVMANADVKTIVLDIDSPGGSVAGSTEFAAELRKARVTKPILAVGQYTMASAAYHLASACTEIIAAPSACTGSVGVYWMHDDLSEALAALGIKRTFVSAGEGKLDGNETQALSVSATARRQATVDSLYTQFVDTVVQGRGQGLTAARVRDEWKAHVYESPDAKRLGLIDTVATLDETIQRVLAASPDAADQRAALAFSSTADTSQEPPKATDQDRRPELALEQQLFELQR
jgi:signal peptide peptidase SppA